MKPRIDINIHNNEGELEDLCDPNTFEPYEVYINNERVCTSEMVEELEVENAKLRKLVLRNLYIALSEREVLRVHSINPDGGSYIAALDNEIATAKNYIQEMGIEMDE